MYTSNQASLVILGIKCCYFNLCIVIIVIFCSESVVGDAVLVKKKIKKFLHCSPILYKCRKLSSDLRWKSIVLVSVGHKFEHFQALTYIV